MADDVCAICMDDLSSEHEHVLEQCGHAFHSRCLIGWFQRGNLSCPNCRADAYHPDNLPAMYVRDRASYIRRTLGRRTTAPPELKTLIATLRTAEQRRRDLRREYMDFQRQHSAILKRVSQLRRKQLTACVAVRKYTRVLGLYQSPSLTLPAVIATRFLQS